MNKLISITKKFIQNTEHIQTFENGTLLLYEEGLELPKHVLYKPLNEQEIHEMKESYKNTFPKSWLEFWRVTNGADLFFAKVPFEGDELCLFQLSFYGLHEYGVDLEYQPFDIAIEDLDKPDYCNADWLKIGSFDVGTDLERVCMYMDTINLDEKVFAYYNDRNELYKSWNSLEECLLDLSDLYSNK